MVQTLYPVFEIDGEEYVADISSILTSNPPQYNAYRLSDKKHRYVFTNQVGITKRVVYPGDFYEFLHGKPSGSLVLSFNGNSISAVTNAAPISSEYVNPVTPNRSYRSRQEELVRVINSQFALVPKGSQELLIRLRRTLLDEQAHLSGPSLAFISGCRLLDRQDLL